MEREPFRIRVGKPAWYGLQKVFLAIFYPGRSLLSCAQRVHRDYALHQRKRVYRPLAAVFYVLCSCGIPYNINCHLNYRVLGQI